jgi:hypothetical protein
MPGASLADLAQEVGWTTKDGKQELAKDRCTRASSSVTRVGRASCKYHNEG